MAEVLQKPLPWGVLKYSASSALPAPAPVRAPLKPWLFSTASRAVVEAVHENGVELPEGEAA